MTILGVEREMQLGLRLMLMLVGEVGTRERQITVVGVGVVCVGGVGVIGV